MTGRQCVPVGPSLEKAIGRPAQPRPSPSAARPGGRQQRDAARQQARADLGDVVEAVLENRPTNADKGRADEDDDQNDRDSRHSPEEPAR